MSSGGGPTGINATALRQWLQNWLKPWAFADIEFGDIAGAQTNGNGDLIASVLTDGTTIGGDGLDQPLFLIKPQLGVLPSGQVVVPAGVYSVDIALAPPLPYSVIMALPNWNTTIYFSGSTINGFTLNFGTQCPPVGGLVMWALN